MVFAWLFDAALSWLGIGVIAAALIGGAVAARYFGLPKWVPLALLAAAGAHIYSGTVYQSGVAACEQHTKEAVAAIEAQWAGMVAQATLANRQQLNAISADKETAEADLAALQAERAKLPIAQQCILTQGDADAINGKK